SRSSFALYSTYFLIHRHCLRPRIVRRIVRHDPRPVHPGGPVNDASFRRAIGADKTAAATPAPFFVRFAQTKNQKPKTKNQKPKTKRKYPAAGRISFANCCGFFRPIRSSPKFAKANSIVWMTPNEWPGAWMPLGRVCSIGFGKRGNSWDAGQRGSQGDTSPCIGVRGRSPVKAGAARKKPSRSDGQPACKAGIRHTQPRRCGHINAAQAGLPARIVTKMSLLRGQRKQRPQKRRPEGRLFF